MIWLHVPTEQNPADLISRGMTVDELRNSQLWWHGPSWLCDSNQRPNKQQEPDKKLPEMRKISFSLVTYTANPLLKISSFNMLCRVIAYCYRFRDVLRKQKKHGPLMPEELEKAEITIIKWTQAQEFPRGLRCLTEGRELPRKSPLRSLHPFIDTQGLIRVGGRLNNAELSDLQKHQMILPAKNHVTTIILRYEHIRLKHYSAEQLLHSIRQKYWPISGRREIQKIVRKCIKCFRFKPSIAEVLMEDLPLERVIKRGRAFITTGD